MRLRTLGFAFLTVVPLAATTMPAAAATPPSSQFVTLRSLGQATSPALRDVPATPIAAGHTGNFPYRPVPHRRVPGALATDPATVQTTASSAVTPTAGSGFAGNTNSDAVLPPDTNGDIGYDEAGNAWYVQWVNLHYTMWKRPVGSSTWTAQLTAAGNSVFANLNNPCSYDNNGDPVVVYDRMAKRWVLTQFAFDSNWLFGTPVPPYGQCVAVSQTGDPTGAYNTYSWNVGHFGNTDYFPDYPKLGVWSNGYYLTFNYFSGSNLSTFNGAGVVILDRTAMLSGGAANADASGPLGSSIASMLPVSVDDGTAPPAGTSESLVAVDTNSTAGGSALQWWHLDNVSWSPVQATLTRLPDVTVGTYNWNLCNQSRNCIPQPGTSVGLDTLSDRLMYRAGYRTVGGQGHVVLNHTVNVASSGTHAAVRWYDVANVTSTPTLVQQGTYAPDADNRWMGSAAMDSVGNIAVGYSVSSSATYPSIRYAGRSPGEPTGTLGAEGTLKAGSGSQTHSSNRWGDYSSLVVDPVDGCTFWYTNEYYQGTSSYSWRTWIGSFTFPNCGSPPPPPPAQPTGLTATGTSGSTMHVAWNLASDAQSYALDRGTSSIGPWQNLASGLTTGSYDDSGLASSTTYWYRLTAYNAGGASSPAFASGTTLVGPPAAPTNLTVKGKTATTVSLAWTGSSGATSYTVYRARSSGGTYATVGTTTSTAFTDTGLAKRTTYYYRVTASNTAGESAPSNTVSARTAKR